MCVCVRMFSLLCQTQTRSIAARIFASLRRRPSARASRPRHRGEAVITFHRSDDKYVYVARARGRFFSASTDRLKRVCVADYHTVCVGECKSTYTLNNKKQFKKRKRHARLSRDRFLIGRPFSISRSLFAGRCHTHGYRAGENPTRGDSERAGAVWFFCANSAISHRRRFHPDRGHRTESFRRGRVRWSQRWRM